MARKVLLTDYAWADLEIERDVLRRADCELIVAPDGSETTLCHLATDVDAIMTTWAKVTRSVIQAAANCRIVARLGIGLDNIDVDYCSARAIPVTNVPDYCRHEVAEHALALMLSLARGIGLFHAHAIAGNYDLKAGPVVRRVAGRTLGIVGCGGIGRVLANMAQGIGLHVVATTRTEHALPDKVTRLSLDDLLAQSDFVSLHVPLTSATERMIGAAELGRMKRGAFLINTARGGLIDHGALADALSSGQIAGAGLDVQFPEPPDLTLPPFNDPRVIVTPHAAFVSVESLEALRHTAATQVVTKLLGGTPDNIVNAPRF